MEHRFRNMRVLSHTVEVAVLVAGIDNKQVFTVRHCINEYIIDDAACVIAEHRVLDPSRPQPRHVATDDPLGQALLRYPQLTHMRKIEETDRLAYGAALLAAGGVLQRHRPATKVRHLSAETDVLLIQRRPRGRHY